MWRWLGIEPRCAQPAIGGGASAPTSRCRRAYYRVSGLLPVRVRALAPDEVDAAIFDLSIPDPSRRPVDDAAREASPELMARLQRLEEKLDLLLGAADLPVPRALSGRDRRRVTFSGAGLALDVAHDFRRGDAFGIELRLPPPYARVVGAVGEAVADAAPVGDPAAPRRLALRFLHMEDEEHDALVSYSYDVQRHALRIRRGAIGGPA